MDENELIQRLHEGKEDAFEQVFRKYFRKLCIYAEHYIIDRSVAEEIVEDFFCFMWDNCNKIKIGSSLSGYLFRSIHNSCLKHLRHEKVRKKYLESGRYIFTDRVLLEPVSDDFPEAILISKDLENEIAAAIDSLPERCRLIFSLSRFENLTYDEISDKLGISRNTIKTQMTRALQKLRVSLKDYL
jgi:RNA polymerase sigma-70 factor (ECF subfamily)